MNLIIILRSQSTLSSKVKTIKNMKVLLYTCFYSSNHENCNIKFSLNTFSNQITIASVKFILEFYISDIKGYLRYKTILCQSSTGCVINKFFYLKKKCFVLEIPRFSCFCETCRFQNLWCHHKYCCIMQVTLMHVCLFLLIPKSNQNEIWSNTSGLYDKHV